ncbi:tripartite motif-containing protein 47-like [Stegastes partitus]|nr:PREDICTED: tripartite motif-containing protein 47-like [Stegastes partitus]
MQSFDVMSEPLKCCICLDDFTRPASLPCGHCFCLGCIGEYWRILKAYRCPLCKALFPTRPQLKTDQTPQPQNAASPLKAGEVPCDFCPAKRPAVKSCLVCLASYCDAHLEPHYQSEDLGRHLLISVVKNLEDSVCRLHGKRLESFCSSDRACICAMCAQTEHRGHHIISIKREAAKKKSIIRRRSLKVQRAIQERQSEVEKIKHSDLSVQDKEPIKQLQEEIAELQERNTELQQLSQTEDNLHLVQRFLHTAL